MEEIVKKYFLLFLLFLIWRTGFSQNLKYTEVRIKTDAAGLKKLARSGLAMEEGFREKDGSWTLVLSSEELQKVKQEGFSPEILHENYARWIIERNLREDTVRLPEIVRDYIVPQHFKLGSMGGFLTLQEVLNELDSMRILYPDLISVKAAAGNGNSIQGRPVYFVKISDHPDVNENEPKILYNSLIHAREPMGMQQMMFFMWYLLENYSAREDIRYLIDNLELYFIPVINPDGYEYNRFLDPNGGGMWRKNRRLTGPQRYGVDLNRNFAYQWAYDDEGSSPDPATETYRGSAAFSEPETQIIRDFCIQKQFRMVMNYHTYGSFLLYPWGYIPLSAPDSLTDSIYSEFLTKKNRYISGIPGQVLYVVNGDAGDWEYGEQILKPKSICFSPEVGNHNDGFWPPPSHIIPLSRIHVYANLMLANLSLPYAEAARRSPYIISGKQGFFKFDFTRYGLEEPANYTVSIEPLDPGVITSIGPSRVWNNPPQFTSGTDSISYTLAENVFPGTEIRYLLKVDNGHFTFKDTITHYFGIPRLILEDHCNNMAYWNSDQWNISLSQYISPVGSITDSPEGSYPPNADLSVTTANSYDPGDSPVSVLEFYTRFNLEKGYDYVQVKASYDHGLTWIPLSGKFTREGSENEANGQPVYDGAQNSWVKEEILLKNFSGKPIQLRFTINSDGWLNLDGFYFDDLTLRAIDLTTSADPESNGKTFFISDPFPNPSNQDVRVNYKTGADPSAVFVMMDSRGSQILNLPLNRFEDELRFNVKGFSPGIYFYYIRSSFGVTKLKKLIIIP